MLRRECGSTKCTKQCQMKKRNVNCSRVFLCFERESRSVLILVCAALSAILTFLSLPFVQICELLHIVRLI